jgi:hypothetical protein
MYVKPFGWFTGIEWLHRRLCTKVRFVFLLREENIKGEDGHRGNPKQGTVILLMAWANLLSIFCSCEV